MDKREENGNQRTSAILATCVLMGIGFSAMGFDGLTAKRVVIDPETGMTIGKNVQIRSNFTTLSSKSAEYQADMSGGVRVMDLSGVVIENNALSGATESATYYPELNSILTRRLVIRPLSRKAQQTLGGSLVAIHCVDGTVYADSTPLGSSWCASWVGGGSTTFTCTGAGGSLLNMVNSPYACQGQ